MNSHEFTRNSHEIHVTSYEFMPMDRRQACRVSPLGGCVWGEFYPLNSLKSNQKKLRFPQKKPLKIRVNLRQFEASIQTAAYPPFTKGTSTLVIAGRRLGPAFPPLSSPRGSGLGLPLPSTSFSFMQRGTAQAMPCSSFVMPCSSSVSMRGAEPGSLAVRTYASAADREEARIGTHGGGTGGAAWWGRLQDIDRLARHALTAKRAMAGSTQQGASGVVQGAT